ncbi:MAG: cytochrome c oxidase subunit [Novosphingobium lindaniclasticum]|jgi:cytochrome c oxidase subunit I+III|uniref:cytochrome c oxidase subunit I n=1 Tax=Novosphingobium lindaniclasticum TaxID=1329895 RepID=UPI002409EC62|nr:cytochrome c oxidase subunit I [Novosphingobium lindaniclasticum]MDF2639479.1 cytochrome c oxidase subunit [Novosphingobium lindaniclasticum]
MSLHDQDDPALRAAQEQRLRAVWEPPKGLFLRWSDTNNNQVGKWYVLTAFAFMLFAGVLALIMRTQLAVPDNDLVGPGTFNQLFTLHGSVMMFLFAVPMFEAVSIILLPQLLGARDLPFPRLSAFGYWSFLLGGVFVSGSIFFDAAPDGGWFMYPPLTTRTDLSGLGADIWMLGLSFIEVSSVAAAVELIVGVLKCRPPGMRLNLMPLYAWYILVVAVMILFAFPPLIAGDVLFEMERLLDWPFFDAARGGDPLLWQHLFWIFGHPEVYIVFLPSIALFAMLVPTFARRHLLGYPWIVLAAVGTAFLSFGLWVHHMFATGLPKISLGFFSAASEAVAIPTAVQIFVFIVTLWAGRVVWSTPLLYATGSLAIFVIGGLTGVMVALAPFDWQAHDTYFVVAHLHYVLIGGTLMPLFAGLYYYWPLVTGKKLSDRLGRIAFWLIFVGANLCFFPMHLSGLEGMPRRVFTYPEELGLGGLNLASTIGSFIIAAGVAVIVFDLCRSPWRKRAPRNPWQAGTLEWLALPEDENWGIRSIPLIESRYPIWDQQDFVRKVDEGRYFLPDAEEGRRETIITSVLDARPVSVIRLGGPGWKPMLTALALGGVFILTTYHLYWPALVCGVVTLAMVLWWLWTGTAEIPEKPCKPIGHGMELPLYISGSASPGWWAMFITMMADATAFSGLVFGYYFFWTRHEAFPPAGMAAAPGMTWPMVALALGLAGWLMTVAAREIHTRGGVGKARLLLVGGLATSIAGVPAGLAGPWLSGMDPTAHSYPAIVWTLAIWTCLHAAVAAIMQAYVLARSLAGRMTPHHDADIRNVTVYMHFFALTVVAAYATIGLFPEVA